MDNQVPLDKQRCVMCKHSSVTASKEPCKSCGNNYDAKTGITIDGNDYAGPYKILIGEQE